MSEETKNMEEPVEDDRGMEVIGRIEQLYAVWKRTADDYDRVLRALDGEMQATEAVLGTTVRIPTVDNYDVEVTVTPEQRDEMLGAAANRLAAKYRETTEQLTELFMELCNLL